MSKEYETWSDPPCRTECSHISLSCQNKEHKEDWLDAKNMEKQLKNNNIKLY